MLRGTFHIFNYNGIIPYDIKYHIMINIISCMIFNLHIYLCNNNNNVNCKEIWFAASTLMRLVSLFLYVLKQMDASYFGLMVIYLIFFLISVK